MKASTHSLRSTVPVVPALSAEKKISRMRNRYTVRTRQVDGTYKVAFMVGNQRFDLRSGYSAEESDWFRDRLAEALVRVVDHGYGAGGRGS